MNLKWIAIILVVVSSSVALISYLGVNGLLAAIPWSLLIVFLTNLEWVASLLASFYKAGRKINFWFEKNAVAKGLEVAIGSSSKKMNKDGIIVLPHDVKIKWTEPEDRGAFLKEGKIVVYLEPSDNEPRNLARASMYYVERDLIRESQRFIELRVKKSVMFTAVRKMLMMDRSLDAFSCFNKEFYEPDIAKYPLIGTYVKVLEKLDSEGSYTRLVLNELSELGAKLSPSTSNQRAEAETASFMQVMKNLSEKQKGVDISPTHRGQIIDFSVMLIARKGVRTPTRYIRYAKECWNEGLPKLYVMAQQKNVIIAISAVLALKTSGLYRVEKEWKFRIPQKRGYFESYIAVLSRIAR